MKDAAPARGPSLRVAPLSVDEVPAAQWDALVPGQPLVSHAFLRALHESGCASRATGWTPCYLGAWRGDTLAGALLRYRKVHSYGEYVFDWAWADAYRRYGRRYYPKFTCAVPFTPVTGPRLVGTGAGVKRALLDAALAALADGRESSLHLLFLDEEDAGICRAAGLIAREGVQFRWKNAGYASFDQFLSTFSHDKRKKVKQDRRRVRDAGVRFERHTGRSIEPRHWDHFFACYERTYREHHSTPYLSRDFFARLADALPEATVMTLGSRDGVPVCAALGIAGPDTLWGRYWGTLDYVPGLHFEACYYQAIEFCIEQGLAAFEGGAQGVHKLARGLAPVVTRSAHAIGDPDFARAIAEFCSRERIDVAHTIDELEGSSPYRHDDGHASPPSPRTPR